MYYFAFGSNMSFAQLQQRGCANFEFIGPAKLNDYKITFSGQSPNWNMKGTANILPSKGDYIWGGLFMVEKDCIGQLNILEHVPDRRKRIKIQVEVGNRIISALAYVIKTDLEANKPSKEYLDKIIEGAKDCKIPKEYIAKLRSYQ